MKKTEVKKLSVEHILSLIYNNKILETALQDVGKEKLVDFITEHFNKGHLQQCFLDNTTYYNYERI